MLHFSSIEFTHHEFPDVQKKTEINQNIFWFSISKLPPFVKIGSLMTDYEGAIEKGALLHDPEVELCKCFFHFVKVNVSNEEFFEP